MTASRRLIETLVTLMVETRDWNPVACRDAVEKTAQIARDLRPASLARIVGAYVDAETDDGRARFTTPALLPEPGPHWDKTPIAERKQRPKCPEHDEYYPCAGCDNARTPPPKDWRQKAREERAANRDARHAAIAEQQARRDAARHDQARKKASRLQTARQELHPKD